VTVVLKRFEQCLFSGLNLEVRSCELIGLTGPSGSGKTTLGNVLLGLKRPVAGRVFWTDTDVYTGSPSTIKSLRPLYQKLYQDPVASFYPGQKVGQALYDVVRYHGLNGLADHGHRIIENILKRLGLCPDLLDRFPHQLSGGELQRMALARILLIKPRFIFADEPTSRLDLSVQAHVIRFIAELAEKDQIGILLVSHDLELLSAVCHRILILNPAFDLNRPAGIKTCL